MSKLTTLEMATTPVASDTRARRVSRTPEALDALRAGRRVRRPTRRVLLGAPPRMLVPAGIAGALVACGRGEPAAPAGTAPARLLYIAASGASKAEQETKLFDDFNRSRPKGDIIVEVSPGPQGSTG